MSERVQGWVNYKQIKIKKMTTKAKMLYTRKELLDLKTKSLKRLQEGKLTKKQEVDIEELLKTIDEILDAMKQPTDNTGWKKAWEIIINIIGIGLPFLIKTLLNKNK